MTNVRLSCPDCHREVVTTTDEVLCLDLGGFSYTTRCPVCEVLIIADCDLSTYSALVAGGAGWTDGFIDFPRSYLDHPSNGGGL